jgi:hypothetical protein
MRMLILATPLFGAATGCIIYDNDGNPNQGPDHIRPELSEDSGMDDIEPQISLQFTPPQAEQGEIFIGSLSVSDGETDLSSVASVTVFGDADVLAIDARPSEVLVTVSVQGDAETSTADIVVEFEDGTAAWLEAGLTISPLGSGNSTDDYTGSTDPAEETEEDPCP